MASSSRQSDRIRNLRGTPVFIAANQPNKRRRTDSDSVSFVKIERSPTPDNLIVIRAQKKALLKAKRDEGFVRLQKDVAELLKGAKSVVNDDDEEGIDPRLTPLKTRFSAVKPKYFRQIRDNKFDPFNISRLYNNVTISRSYKAKYIDLGKNIEVKMKEEDATESGIKGLALLLRGLFVYFQIQLHVTEDANHRSLSVAY
ncbi:hypothetical protein MMC22_004128 [Lobaria immixta]|nr:hypothetical protein [Lobaria immixta]